MSPLNATLPVLQGDWGAGIYRGREAPENAAYDLLNVILDDEGQPRRRAGSAYKSNANAGGTLLGLWDGLLAAGQRTAFWTSAAIYALGADDASILSLALSPNSSVPRALARGVGLGGYVFFPGTAIKSEIAYAGSRKTATVTQSAVTSLGSNTVSFVSTNVDVGMILRHANGVLGIVQRIVDPNTIDLTKPITSSSLAGGLSNVSAVPVYSYTAPLGSGAYPYEPQNPTYLATAGSRLLRCADNRVAYSAPVTEGAFTVPTLAGYATTNDYLELPAGALIIGAEGVGDSSLIFTTSGIWRIDNLSFDAIDDAGNVQWVQRRANELVLWGDPGIVQWQGTVLAPCVDDVWLVTLDAAPAPIAGGVKPLYLEYVKAGYQPGTAAVHRGQYFLPIVNSSNVLQDMLVCRLDRGFAWTRWAGHGAGVAYAQRIGAATRSPKLFSVAAQRVTELTDAWSPSASNASEADGTAHTLRIETRDFATPGGGNGSTTRKVRVRYEATAAGTPTFTVSYARGPEGSAYTALSPLDGTAAGVSDGARDKGYAVGKQAQSIRYRIESSSALSTFTLRAIVNEHTPRGA